MPDETPAPAVTHRPKRHTHRPSKSRKLATDILDAFVPTNPTTAAQLRRMQRGRRQELPPTP